RPSGARTAEGNSTANVQAAQNAFYANAGAMGIKLKKRQAFGTLFNGVSVSVPLAQAGTLWSVPGVTAVYPVRQSTEGPDQTVPGTPADLGSNPMIGVDPLAGGVGA